MVDGELAEVWFDGGYPPGTADLIAALLAKLQPNAVAFQGPGDNVVRLVMHKLRRLLITLLSWVGTESGHASYPQWSTAASSTTPGAGNSSGTVFVPSESDTCFQSKCQHDGEVATKHLDAPYGGCWFYK